MSKELEVGVRTYTLDCLLTSTHALVCVGLPPIEATKGFGSLDMVKGIISHTVWVLGSQF